MPDSSLLLQLIHCMYICRSSLYTYDLPQFSIILFQLMYRGHGNDEKKIYELLIRIFRSPELLMKLTEQRADYHCVKRLKNEQ